MLFNDYKQKLKLMKGPTLKDFLNFIACIGSVL